MKKLLLGLAFCATMFSCQNRGGADKAVAADIAIAPAPAMDEALVEQETVGANQSPATTDKKVVKEGEISFEAGDVNKARHALMQNLKKLGGYLDEEREYKGEADRKEYLLKVRIPAKNFEKFLAAVNETADRVESKNIRIRDVTTEYIDVTTRLNNKKLLENRYKVLLQQSSKMSDILAVENKLSEIRTDIETAQGQLNYLSKQIAYSTLDVTFFTKASADSNKGNGFGYQFKNAIDDSWELLQSLFFGLISIWPVIALLTIVWLLFKAWRKRRAKRKSMV